MYMNYEKRWYKKKKTTRQAKRVHEQKKNRSEIPRTSRSKHAFENTSSHSTYDVIKTKIHEYTHCTHYANKQYKTRHIQSKRRI